MKTRLVKDSGLISLGITVALFLLFSAFAGYGQGQSCKKTVLYKNMDSWVEGYNKLLREKYSMPAADSCKYRVKKTTGHGGSNSMKRIKKGVSYMLISENAFGRMKYDVAEEFCCLSVPAYLKYICYEESK